MSMQNQGKKKRKKPELVYKPYLKGNWHGASALKKCGKILVYYLIFAFMYLLLGAILQSDTPALAWGLNAVALFLCGALMYTDGARTGENETALGEIAYSRQQAGKEVKPQEKDKCFHPAKGWFTAFAALLPLIIVCAVYAVMAQKQLYQLQALPSWVTAFEQDGEVLRPLQYYTTGASVTVEDILRVIVRMLIFPFVQIARLYGNDGILLADRLSPLLVCVPALGYPLGYLTGPRSRAMVHGNIRTNDRRALRRKKKAVKASRQRTEKKNELI